MMTSEDRLERLISWVHANLERLRLEPSVDVADELGEELLRVDDQLGVEVGENDAGDREVIVTAFSEPRLFPLVRRIVERFPRVPGWRFVALKPPRGFDFTLTVGKYPVDAENFAFTPLPDVDRGIYLLHPERILDNLSRKNAAELAWLVVETGIGEELAARLQHVKISDSDSEQGWHPIAELEAYVRENVNKAAE